jgi:hypothetical protein
VTTPKYTLAAQALQRCPMQEAAPLSGGVAAAAAAAPLAQMAAAEAAPLAAAAAAPLAPLPPYSRAFYQPRMLRVYSYLPDLSYSMHHATTLRFPPEKEERAASYLCEGIEGVALGRGSEARIARAVVRACGYVLYPGDVCLGRFDKLRKQTEELQTIETYHQVEQDCRGHGSLLFGSEVGPVYDGGAKQLMALCNNRASPRLLGLVPMETHVVNEFFEVVVWHLMAASNAPSLSAAFAEDFEGVEDAQNAVFAAARAHSLKPRRSLQVVHSQGDAAEISDLYGHIQTLQKWDKAVPWILAALEGQTCTLDGLFRRGEAAITRERIAFHKKLQAAVRRARLAKAESFRQRMTAELFVAMLDAGGHSGMFRPTYTQIRAAASEVDDADAASEVDDADADADAASEADDAGAASEVDDAGAVSAVGAVSGTDGACASRKRRREDDSRPPTPNPTPRSSAS